MNRRELISVLASAGACPVWAQQAMPVIGYLSGRSSEKEKSEVAAFINGLAQSGYIENQNVGIVYRWADEQYDRLPAMARELIGQQVTVMMAAGNVAARAAKEATATIPIVFHTGDDPIAVGLVASLNQPTGNLTGVSAMAGTLPGKRLQLLHELVPTATAIGALINPSNANAEPDMAAFHAAARIMGLQVHVLNATSERDFEKAFATLRQMQTDALVVNTDALLTSRRDQLVELGARYRIPTIYSFREFVAAGGLMCYGANRSDTYRQAGVYTGRILKGEKPADLPVMQPTKFE